MMQRFLIATPAGRTRELLAAFFASRASEVVVLRREEIGRGQQLVIEDTRVLVDEREILPSLLDPNAGLAEQAPDAAGLDAAIITDSGFMWQLPMLDPTEEQWAEQAGSLDAFLRDERESASLWFSLMEILSDRVPVCINAQAAFELAAMKPWALEVLQRAGVSVAPVLTTNDPSAVRDFVAGHAGPILRLELASAPSVDAPRAESASWLDADEARELDLSREPAMLQRLDDRSEVVVVAVAGEAVAWAGPAQLPAAVAAQLALAQQALAAPWATLVFRRAGGEEVLSDFSPAPELAAWPREAQERVLQALGELVDQRRALREGRRR